MDTAVGSPLEDGTTTYGMNTGTGVLFKTVSISPTWVQQNNSVALTFVPDIQILHLSITAAIHDMNTNPQD